MPSEDRYNRIANLRSASVSSLIVEGLLETGKSGKLRAYSSSPHIPHFAVEVPSGSVLCAYGDLQNFDFDTAATTFAGEGLGIFLVKSLPALSGSSVYSMLSSDADTFVESVHANCAILFNLRPPSIESILEKVREDAVTHLSKLLGVAHQRVSDIVSKGNNVFVPGDYSSWPTRSVNKRTAAAISAILSQEYSGELVTVSWYNTSKELGPAFVGHPQAEVSVTDEGFCIRVPLDLRTEIVKEHTHTDLLSIQENMLRENDEFNEAILAIIDGPPASPADVACSKEEILDEVTCWLVQQVARLSFSLNNMQAVSAKLREAGSSLMMAGSAQL